MSYREQQTQATELLASASRGGLDFSPVQFRPQDLSEQVQSASQPDYIIDVIWQQRSCRFVVEYKTLSTPRIIDNAIIQAEQYAHVTGLLPMIIVPFLTEERLRQLEEQGVSGIDLCGNGVIVAPDFAVWRSGQPNLFKNSQPIKNIYRGTSSIFARCFLLQSEFLSITQLRDFALKHLAPRVEDTNRMGTLTQSTASKVVQTLDQELIVAKASQRLRLVNAQALLTRLQLNYRSPEGARLIGKTTLSSSEIWQRIKGEQGGRPLRAVATGLSSVQRYGVLSGGDKLALYVSSLDVAAERLEIKPTRVFPNIELIEDKSDLVYFDARQTNEEVWASPIQTWLELASGLPRERGAAQTLEQALLQGRAKELL